MGENRGFMGNKLKKHWKGQAVLALVLAVLLFFLSVDYIWAEPLTTGPWTGDCEREDGEVNWDASENQLTMNSAVVSGGALNISMVDKLELNGANTIENMTGEKDPLTVTGSGTLVKTGSAVLFNEPRKYKVNGTEIQKYYTVSVNDSEVQDAVVKKGDTSAKSMDLLSGVTVTLYADETDSFVKWNDSMKHSPQEVTVGSADLSFSPEYYKETITDSNIELNSAVITVVDGKQSPKITVHDPEGGEQLLVEGTDYTVSGRTDTITPGQIISYVIAGTGRYDGSVTKNWTAPSEMVMVSAPPATFLYDGNLHSVPITLESAPAGSKLLYAESNAPGAVYSENIIQKTNAETYTIWYKVSVPAVGANPAFETDPASTTLTIQKKNLTVRPNNCSRAWGENNPDFEYTAIGLVEGDPLTFTLTCDALPGSDVGSYTIVVTPKPVYEVANYNVSYETGTLTVNGKPLSTCVISAEDVEYTGDPVTTTVSVLDGSKPLVKDVDFTVAGDTANSWQAGDLTVGLTGKGNYIGTDSATWKMIDKKPPEGTLTVEPPGISGLIVGDITWGEFINRTPIITIIGSDAETGIASLKYCILNRTQAGDVYKTAAELDTLDWQTYDENNKPRLDNDDQWVVYAQIKDNSGNVTYLSSKGYSIDTTAPLITPSPANTGFLETDAATGVHRYYDSAFGFEVADDHLSTVKIDNVSVATGGAYSIDPDDSSHTIVAEDTAGNTSDYVVEVYNYYELDGDAADINLVYDGTAHAIDVTILNQDLRNCTIKYALTETGPYKIENPKFTDACGATPVYYQATTTDGRYHNVVTGSATVAIKKKPVRIQPAPMEKIYGSADPEFTFEVSGLVTGVDTKENVFAGLKPSRVSGENVGQYSYTVGSLSGAKNYAPSIAADAALFTIKPKSLKSADIYLDMDKVKIHTGEEIVNVPVLRDKEVTLVEGKDYTVTGNRETDWNEPGTCYTAVITGKGNYYGELTFEWQIKDTSRAVGEIRIEDNVWMTFLNTITFGTYFNETKKVTIYANDIGSGVAEVAYLVLHAPVEGGEYDRVRAVLDATEGWTVIQNGGSFSIDPNEDYVIYARITDNAGNKTYISSDGVVLDNILPEITGIEDGGRYAHDVVFKITDEHLEKVEIDGVAQEITSSYSLSVDGATHEIVAVDRAGNRTSVTITLVKPQEQEKVEEEVIEKGSITTEVSYGPGVPEMNVKKFGTDVAKDLCTPEEIHDVRKEGANIDVYMDILRLSGESLPEEDRILVEKAAKEWNKKAKAGLYLDISLYKQDETTEKLKNTNGHMIVMEMKVPSELRPSSKKVNRTYCVFRVHNGKVKRLLETKSFNMKFSSDRFSTYALAYYDTKDTSGGGGGESGGDIDDGGGSGGGGSGGGGGETPAPGPNPGPTPGPTPGPVPDPAPVPGPQTPAPGGPLAAEIKDPELEARLALEMAALAGQEGAPAQAEVIQGEIAAAQSAPANNAEFTKLTHKGDPKSPKTADTSNMPLWVTAVMILFAMFLLMTLMGRNFGLFPYPTKEHMNRVIKRICSVGNRHRRLRYLMFFIIVGYVFLLNIYKHLFFSDAARKTYAKA